MITYSVAVHRIKTLEEMERDEAKLKKNALIEPKLLEKWNTWFQNNTYYKNHKIRSNGTLVALYTIRLNGLEGKFDYYKWHQKNREWFQDYTYKANEYSFILTSTMSLSKDRKSLYENVVVVSPNQEGRLSYQVFFSLTSFRILQKNYAKFMAEYDAISIPTVNPANSKIETKSAQGLHEEHKDLPVKKPDESDDEYYERVNTLFHSYCERYQKELKKNSRSRNELKETVKQLSNESDKLSERVELTKTLQKSNDHLSDNIDELKKNNIKLATINNELLKQNKKLSEQMTEYLSIVGKYGGVDAIKTGMRFSLVIKCARRYYQENDTTMMKKLDDMVRAGEKYAKEIGVEL